MQVFVGNGKLGSISETLTSLDVVWSFGYWANTIVLLRAMRTVMEPGRAFNLGGECGCRTGVHDGGPF